MNFLYIKMYGHEEQESRVHTDFYESTLFTKELVTSYMNFYSFFFDFGFLFSEEYLENFSSIA